MSSNSVTVRFRKFLTNRLLGRKQMIIDVYHPGKAMVTHADLKAQLASHFKVKDESVIQTFGFKTQFGGGKSTGFALVYDSVESMLDSEPKHRLIRAGLKKKPQGLRKTRKELKNKRKKIRGKNKNKGIGGQK